MKHLYTAETNAMRMYFVEDWDTDLVICVDWDLDEEEEKALIKSFENGTLDETANGGEWQDEDTAYVDTFAKRLLV